MSFDFPSDNDQNSDDWANQDDEAGDDGEECIIDESDIDIAISDSQLMPNPDSMRLQAIISTYNAYLYYAPAEMVTNCRIHLQLPSKFLPLSMQAVYGFTVSPILLDIIFELNSGKWNFRPDILDVRHPVYGTTFIGKVLVQSAISDFFSPHFSPRIIYRSESYLLTPEGTANETYLSILIKEGYLPDRASNALVLCSNDMESARHFLRTGELKEIQSQVRVSYQDCPLIYLLLEVAEAFLDLSDHCCICRKPLPFPGLKPSVCNQEICKFSLTDIGVGNSVLQEIKRDPVVADLFTTIFAAAVGTEFLTPAPYGFTDKEMKEILSTLPPMRTLAASHRNDQELAHTIGDRAMQLLRFIIMSNRSHLISIPNELTLSDLPNCHQFMALISTPEKEKQFDAHVVKYGKLNLWHGSRICRWHSILHNGLKNASNTNLMSNGAAFGPGIYLARNSNTSFSYSQSMLSDVVYKNSILGKCPTILAICDIAMVPNLKDNGWCHTLQDESACVVRFLISSQNPFSRDLVSNPLTDVPKLRDVLDYIASHGQL